MSTTDPFGTLLGLGFLAWTLWYLAVWLKYGIRDAKTARLARKQKRASAHARVLEARAPMPLPVPNPVPSWLPISHDDVLLCLSPGVRAEFEDSARKDQGPLGPRADFQKDEPSSSSISPVIEVKPTGFTLSSNQ